jgi:glycosyltransferase involved in cell wall biosynthesis
LPAPLTLVLPADHDAVSGGNLYNARLLAALRRADADAGMLSSASGGSVPDTDLFIDSVLRARVPEFVAAGARVFVVVHLFPSFVAGADAAGARERERALLRGVAGFVVTCRRTHELLAPLAEGRPVLVVPPGLVVEPPPVIPSRAPGCRALIAASLIACKGVLPFLERLDAAVRDGDAFTLDVVGRHDFEPGYARACVELVAASPRLRARVRLHGPVPAAAMPGRYLASTVFLSPATFETYGMAMREARAFGLRLLALDAGAAREFVTRPEHGAVLRDAAELAGAFLAEARDLAAHHARVRAAAAHPLRSTWTWDDAARSLLAQLAQTSRS